MQHITIRGCVGLHIMYFECLEIVVSVNSCMLEIFYTSMDLHTSELRMLMAACSYNSVIHSSII
jgi:hypothetical protein